MWVILRPDGHEFRGVGPDGSRHRIWLARMWWTLPDAEPTNSVFAADTLAELRTLLPPGVTNIGRQSGDLPNIEEVWL